MTIFGWLLIAHLVGDFVLQNDWMARNKQRALFTIPGFTHFAVYTFTLLLVLWLYKQFPASGDDSLMMLNGNHYLLFATIIFISHWLIDATNAAGRWGRMLQQGDILFVRVVVDQTFHLVALGAVSQWLFV